jgi:hypothetical protein
MRHSLFLLPLIALVGCNSEPTYQQYPAQYAYPVQQAPACQPVAPCAPGYRPYQYSNYVPPGIPPIQQANFQGPPPPPQTAEPQPIRP